MKGAWWRSGLHHLAPALVPVAGWLYAVAIVVDNLKKKPQTRTGAIDYGPQAMGPGEAADKGGGGGNSLTESAGRMRRGVAFLADGLIFWLLALVPLVGWLAGASFLCLRDSFIFGGRSPGKRLLGLSIRKRDGGAWEGTAVGSFRRNITLAFPLAQFLLIPLEALLVSWMGGGRLGDRWAGTEVVWEGGKCE